MPCTTLYVTLGQMRLNDRLDLHQSIIQTPNHTVLIPMCRDMFLASLKCHPSIHPSTVPYSLYIPSSRPTTPRTIYMPFKKLLSLILFLLSLLIASLSSSLLSPASNAPLIVPSSFAGRSIDCCVSGIFGSSTLRSPDARRAASSFR